MKTLFCLTVKVNTSEEKTLAKDQNGARLWRNSTAGLGAIETNGVIFTLIILHNSSPNLCAGV